MSVFFKSLFFTALFSACLSCGDGGVLNSKKATTTDIGTSPETCDKSKTCGTDVDKKTLLALQELRELVESLKQKACTHDNPCLPEDKDIKDKGILEDNFLKIIQAMSGEKQKLEEIIEALRKVSPRLKTKFRNITLAAEQHYTKTMNADKLEAHVKLTGHFITYMDHHAPLHDECYSDDIGIIETGCIAKYDKQIRNMYDKANGY
jgi:hypothetical protein